MNVLISTGSLSFKQEYFEKLKELNGGQLWIQDDERLPIEHDISKVEFLATFNLLKFNDIDDFTSLKCVQSMMSGIDHFPLDKLKQRNIPIYRATDVYSIAISEFVLSRTLQIYKNLRFFDENQKNSKWEKSKNLFELTDKRVCIVGYGSIGRETAKRFKAFDAKIISISRSEKSCEYIDEQYHISRLNEILPTCDIVVICVPHTKETDKLFDYDMLNSMKNSSVLINVARGKIIDDEALIKHLQNNKFLGVALDVFSSEPYPSDNELWKFDRAYLSPHNCYQSDVIEKRLFECVYNRLKKTIKGENN